MGASITKEERTAIRWMNERIFAKIEKYRGTVEARYVKKTVYDAKKLVRKKEGEVLATKGQLAAPFMLIEGTIRIHDYIRTRPGVFCAECFFNIESFNDVIAETACTVLQLNPKCNSLHLRTDIFEKFIRYVPIHPIAIHNPKVKELLKIDEVNAKYGNAWWAQSIAASVLDRAVGLSSTDAKFDVSKRPDFRDHILQIMEHYKDVPKFISVPAQSDPVVIQRIGEVPTCSWLLIAGTAQAMVDDEEADVISDSDLVAMLETNVCTQYPASANYSILPGSIAVSISRKTMLAVQFIKAFTMNADNAIKAVNESRVFTLNRGDRIDEDKWYKGIIFDGKLNLIALPPGRASEFEKYRRTVVEERGSTITQRKSCRIATSMEYGFEKCGPFDEFIAMEPTIGIITTGVPSLEHDFTEDDVKLSTLKEESEEET